MTVSTAMQKHLNWARDHREKWSKVQPDPLLQVARPKKGKPTMFAIPISLRSWMLFMTPAEHLQRLHTLDILDVGAALEHGTNTELPDDILAQAIFNRSLYGGGKLLETMPTPDMNDPPITYGPRMGELYPNLARLR